MTDSNPATPTGRPPTTPSRRWLWPTLGSAVIAVAVLVVFLLWPKGDDDGTGNERQGTIAVVGALAMRGSGAVSVFGDGQCTGVERFGDMHEGTPVTITDQTGAELGRGALKAGVVRGSGIAQECVLAFTVPNVPPGRGSYGIEISNRGVRQYTEAQLRSPIEIKLRG